MAKPNYAFEKRQRELAKKRKQEEKRNRKAAAPQAGDQPESPGDVSPEATSESNPPA
jgi:hypothetical protein